jgi:Na+/glutamate symporter
MTRTRSTTGILTMVLGCGLGIGGAWAPLRYAPDAGLGPGAAAALATVALVLGGLTVQVAAWRTVPRRDRTL